MWVGRYIVITVFVVFAKLRQWNLGQLPVETTCHPSLTGVAK